MNRETSREDEWDQGQDSDSEGEEGDEGDEEVGKPTRNGIDMKDILELTAKLPTQKQENEEVAGAQQITYTKEQIEHMQFVWKEQMMLKEMKEIQERKAAESTTTEGNSKLTTPEKKTRKETLLSKTSSASKPKKEKR